MKILLLAYQVSPYRGSEYSVAWNYIKYMSKDNELIVLYGVSDEHLGEINEMEEYLKKNIVKNVEFIAVHANKKIERLNWLNRRGIFNYSFYIAFKEWQKQAYLEAKKNYRR